MGLLEALAPPVKQRDDVEGGIVNEDQFVTLLSYLNPFDYRNQEDWLKLMMASHHATTGSGLAVFEKWCAGDPNYAGDPSIANRWNSLKDRNGGITYRTRMALPVW
ncbi:MAG: hypothetical protein ACI814_005156 [Mariniblastus sp.]